MTMKTETAPQGGRSHRENTRAALAAALAGNCPPQAVPATLAKAPTAPDLNGLTATAEQLQAAALVAVRQAATVRDLAAVFEVLQPGRDKSRKARLAPWLAKVGDFALADVTTDQVDEVLAELEATPTPSGKPRTGGTINRYRASFASLVKFARKHRRVPRGWVSPLAELPLNREAPGRLRYLSEEEEQRLMAAATVQRWPLLPLLIRMAVVTGLRRGALVALTWADVDSTANVVRIARTKNGSAHVAPLTADLVAALQAVKPANAQPTHLIFAGKEPNRAHNFEHSFKAALVVAGIEGASFHTLRHTSCSRLAQAGRSLLEIAEHAGHRNLSMTRRYAHLSTKGRAGMVAEVFG